MKFVIGLLALVSILAVNPTSADVSLSRVDEDNPNWRTNPHLFISGKIQLGDYERAINAVKEVYTQGDIGRLFVYLDSPGGDVLEAMRIGRLVRKLKLTTLVGRGQCSSACVFILVSGAQRVGGSIGIHRPHFNTEYFSGLSAEEAKNKYEEMSAAAKAYLMEMGVASEFIERMFRTASNEIDKLTSEEEQKWIEGSSAALDEWLIAKCGSYTKDEANDYSMWLAQRVDLKPGYASYLKEKINKVDNCRMGALATEHERTAEKLFSTTSMPKK